MDSFTEEMFTINPTLAYLKELLTNETRRQGLVLQLTVLPQLPAGAAVDNKQKTQPPPYVDEDMSDPTDTEEAAEQHRPQEGSMEPDSYQGEDEESGEESGEESDGEEARNRKLPVPDVAKYLRVAGSHYRHALAYILDAFLRGYGSTYSIEHSVTINFELGFTNARCTCDDCCNGLISC